MLQTSALQILQCFGTLLDCFVAVIHHLAQHKLIVLIVIEWSLKLHGRRRCLSHNLSRCGQRRMARSEKFHRMPEAYAQDSHDPVDYRTSRPARAQAMPQVLTQRDHKRRRVIFMERAQANQVRSVAFQLDPSRLGQSLHRQLSLQPHELMLRNPCPSTTLSRRLSRFTA